MIPREGFGADEARRIFVALTTAGYAIGPGDVRCGSEQGLCAVLAGRDEVRCAQVRQIVIEACEGPRT